MAISVVVIFALLSRCYGFHNDSSIDFFSNVDHPGRIVGGSIAAEGSHPYMAALTSGFFIRSYFCGGSVISTRTVLTAAHCVDTVYKFGFLSRSLRVIVGTNQWHRGGQSYSVSGNVTHRRWSPLLVKNDVAILHTIAAIEYNKFVRLIPLSYENVGDGVLAKAAGWGRTSVYGPISLQLLELTVRTISAEQCAHDVIQARVALKTTSPPYDGRIELCTVHEPGRGMCRGDSGGALIRLDQNTQTGVVSWGFPCARAAPDVHARVSAYEPWIQKNIKL